MTVDHRLAATETPKEVDAHQASILAVTSDGAFQFYLCSSLSAQPNISGNREKRNDAALNSP